MSNQLGLRRVCFIDRLLNVAVLEVFTEKRRCRSSIRSISGVSGVIGRPERCHKLDQIKVAVDLG